MEMQDLGTRLRMVVMAHRRISLLKKVEETFDPKEVPPMPTPETSFMDVSMSSSSSSQSTFHDGVYIVETDNLVHEPFETTDEIKALTQEVIKTIRDIIVSINISWPFILV